MAFWRKKPKVPSSIPPRITDIPITDIIPITDYLPPVERPAFDLEEYQRALEQGVVLSAYARVMFVGPGGVGKSSLLHGLMNKLLPQANSTQLAETVTVKPATKKWASAGEDSKSFWREVTDNDEMMEIVGLILLVANVTTGHSNSSRFVSQKVAALNIFSSALASVEIANGQQKTSAGVQHGIIKNILTEVIELAKKYPDAQAPEKEVLILNWDCGGQAIFLDILPAFLTPRTMFLLFYDARRIADSCIIRSFHNGKMIDFQEQRTTTVEMLLEWMASIHAMLVPISQEESVPNFPRIIPIGTHGDDPNINKEEIIQHLNVECEGKAFIPILKRGVIVDNTTAGLGENEDPAFRSIRKEVYDFASKDLIVETPVAWVLFRRVFQKVAKDASSPIIPYQTVEEIATACNVPLTAISTMVQFYHDLAVFFHYNEVPSLKGYVIADPQWLIRQFAKIMAPKGFANQFLDDKDWKGHELLWARLWDSGILVQSLYKEVWKDCEVPAQSLVDLLVHFLLAAPICKASRVTNFHGKEYFISSVLPTFKPKPNNQRAQCVAIKQTAPLHLIFNTFYVPPGFFCRLVTALLNTSCFQIAFNQGVYRDRIVLLYGEYNLEIDEVVLEKHKNSIQVEIIRTRDRREGDRRQGGTPFSVACHEVLNIINKCHPEILLWLKGIEINYAFVCEYCELSNEQHFMRFSFASINVFCNELRCDQKQFARLTTSHKYWLPICEDKHVSTPDMELTTTELREAGGAVEGRVRLNELVKVLEMSYTQSTLANDLNPACTVLFNWSREMTLREYPNTRLHLVHYLTTIGMHDIACRLQMPAQQSVSGQLQVTTSNLDQMIDSMNKNVPIHVGLIADFMSEWEGGIAEALGLTPAEVQYIKGKHINELNLQKREALHLWKQKLGNGATYRNLITVFESAGYKLYADLVRKIIDLEKGSPLAAQQLGGGWQSGSQWGTAASGSQQLQSQVPQGTDGFSNKAPFTSHIGTQPQQSQQNSGSIEQLQQQFRSMSISGVQYPQKLQSSQQQCTESQWPQPFTGVQQPQQQLETFTEAKQPQQQFEQFTSPQQWHQSFNMPQYSQQHQPCAWAQPSQLQLQQSQQIPGAQQPFNIEMQHHFQSYATAQPPQQQRFSQPLQQSFGTMHSPQGQFNVAQQPQQVLFAGNQQQFESAQQPQQQWRTYTGSHHQQQPIQQPLQPHQQRPVNINPFTEKEIQEQCTQEVTNPFASIHSFSRGDRTDGISFPNEQQPYLKERELHPPQTNPFASNRPGGDGGFQIAFPDQRYPFIEGGTLQKSFSGNQFSSTSQGNQNHGVQAGWEAFQRENQPAQWPPLGVQPSQHPYDSSWNPFAEQLTSHTLAGLEAEVPQMRQSNPFASGNVVSDSNQTGWATFEEKEQDLLKDRGIPVSASQQIPFTPGSSTNPFL